MIYWVKQDLKAELNINQLEHSYITEKTIGGKSLENILLRDHISLILLSL